jgi:hypothetical protein
MTKDEARAALAEQPWELAARGWTVPADLHGWRSQVEPALGGMRVTASAAGGEPAVWFVPARH